MSENEASSLSADGRSKSSTTAKSKATDLRSLRAAELEEIRKKQLTKSLHVQYDAEGKPATTLKSPKPLDAWHMEQRARKQEGRKRETDAVKILHSYRGDASDILRHSGFKSGSGSSSSTRSPTARADVVASPRRGGGEGLPATAGSVSAIAATFSPTTMPISQNTEEVAASFVEDSITKSAPTGTAVGEGHFFSTDEEPEPRRTLKLEGVTEGSNSDYEFGDAEIVSAAAEDKNYTMVEHPAAITNFSDEEDACTPRTSDEKEEWIVISDNDEDNKKETGMSSLHNGEVKAVDQQKTATSEGEDMVQFAETLLSLPDTPLEMPPSAENMMKTSETLVSTPAPAEYNETAPAIDTAPSSFASNYETIHKDGQEESEAQTVPLRKANHFVANDEMSFYDKTHNESSMTLPEFSDKFRNITRFDSSYGAISSTSDDVQQNTVRCDIDFSFGVLTRQSFAPPTARLPKPPRELTYDVFNNKSDGNRAMTAIGANFLKKFMTATADVVETALMQKRARSEEEFRTVGRNGLNESSIEVTYDPDVAPFVRSIEDDVFYSPPGNNPNIMRCMVKATIPVFVHNGSDNDIERVRAEVLDALRMAVADGTFMEGVGRSFREGAYA